MNKYLEKIAATAKKPSDDEIAQRKALAYAGGTLGALGGAGVIHNELARGNLTGRETLYHGTSEDRAKAIRQQGLKPNTAGGVSSLAGLSDANKNLVFADSRKHLARQYAIQQGLIDKGTFDAYDIKGRQLNAMKAMIPGTYEKSIVKLNVPTWKEDMKGAWNPEVRKTLRHPLFGLQAAMAGKSEDEYKRMIYDTFQKHVYVHRGPEGIGTEYIKGSDAYKGNTLGEIKEYIKANPKRFLKGLGKAGLGAGAIGLSAYGINKAHQLGLTDNE